MVPVSYVYRNGKFFVPTHSQAKKVRNLRENNRATIVVEDEGLERGIMIECKSRLLGPSSAQPLLEHMRKVKNWKNDKTTAVIELNPRRKVSWFLK